MKKILILIALVISVLALLPIVGNKLVNDTLNEQVEILKSNGIKTIDSRRDSRYLSTSRHYKFILEDMDRFLEYIGRYSYEQLPPYTSSLLKGTVVGVDISYSNIPFAKAVSMDIYPLSLSDDIMDEIKENDESFYSYLKSFFTKKGILYHINYNIVSGDFDGYIKDIEENQVLKNSSILLADISDATFKGSGTLLAPEYLKTDAKRVKIDISNTTEKLSISLDDFSSETTFRSRNSYDSMMKLRSLSIYSKAKEPITIDISDMLVDISSSTNGVKAEIVSKSSFSDINITSDIININASGFNYDISAYDLDKDALEELRILLSRSKTKNSIALLSMIKNSALNMLSKGLSVDIKDISMKKININGENLKGFSMQSKLNLKEDKYLSKKIDYAPLFIAQNLDLDFNFRVSQSLYSKLAYMQPIAIFAQGYAKKSADDLVFDFTLNNGEFKINGKAPLN